MAKQSTKSTEPKAPKVPASKQLKANDQASEQPIAQTVPATVQVSKPAGPAQRLGKGLWGIVSNKTRYSTVTQFSGLEYVRYEYRLIPEQYRDAAFKSEFLDVVDITEEPVIEEVIDAGEDISDEFIATDAEIIAEIQAATEIKQLYEFQSRFPHRSQAVEHAINVKGEELNDLENAAAGRTGETTIPATDGSEDSKG